MWLRAGFIWHVGAAFNTPVFVNVTRAIEETGYHIDGYQSFGAGIAGHFRMIDRKCRFALHPNAVGSFYVDEEQAHFIRSLDVTQGLKHPVSVISRQDQLL